MPRFPPLRLLLAAPWVCQAAVPAQEPAPPQPEAISKVAQPVLLALDVQGGSADDAAFARAAAGLAPGAPASPADVAAALAAVRLTDRFRRVDGQLLPGPDGTRVVIRLDPWPAVKRLEWSGDARRKEVRSFIRGLRKGMHPGDQRLAAWSGDLQTRLVEAGYPEAQVAWARGDGDRTLVVSVDAGKPALVRRVDLVGDPAPYTRRDLLKASGLEPGHSLWSQPAQLAAVRGLRKMFHSHNRFEAKVEVAWEGDGSVRLGIRPGPRVNLTETGDGLGRGGNLKDLVPLARADRYTPELLDEGDRLIVRHLRGQGYLDAQVTHRREVTSYPGTPFEEVTVTYTIHRGPQSHLQDLRFEGNAALSESELRDAAAIHRGLLAPKVTPDLLDALEDRVKGVYLSRGFTDTSLRRQLERQDGRTALVMRIREGPQRLVPYLRLELPSGGVGDPWSLGECLALIFADAPARGAVAGDAPRTFTSDRPAMAGVRGTLTLQPGAPGAPVVLMFTLSRPIPLLKVDLARVYTALKQQRLPALGLVRPVVRLTLEPGADGSTGVRLEVPAQPVERIQRLVVTGSDKTRAEAVLRETRIQPGAPMDTDQLSRAQARLNTVGAFQRVEMKSLAPGAEEAGQAAGPATAWKPGDLQLTVEERPPYVVTNSFGYDKSQGYHVGVGLQQLNVGGMGRTLDYGIRAGNGTIHNPTLAKWFPTGTYDRSVDSFTVAYTDPWFAPGVLKTWLPDRTQSRTEGGYIEERRDLYILHRRRFTSALQWSLSPRVAMSVGYRWERTDVVPGVAGIDASDLEIYARYPRSSTVSAPYLQVARDTRDNSFDPTSGTYSVARVEFANQLFLTTPNASFVKLDLRNQWTWPVGRKARAGVVAFGIRLGAAKPTAATAQNLPLSERFFAGGPFSFRGVEPDALGVQAHVPKRNPDGSLVLQPDGVTPVFFPTPVGGQGLVLMNLEYRFPFLGKSVWGEVFADCGQVYQSLSRLSPEERTQQAGGNQPTSAYPPLRTALGLGLIFKIGLPLKIEYAADLRRLLGRPRTQDDRDTQLKSLLISAGFQF